MKSMVIIFLAASVLLLSPSGRAQAVTMPQPHEFTCATCHASHKSLGSTGYDNICLNCHRGGDPRGGGRSFAPGDAADPFGLYTAGMSGRLQISHRWDGSDTNLRAGALPPVTGQMTSAGIRGRASNAMACVRCHNPHSQENRPFLRMANDADQMCLDCHRSRNTADQSKGTHPVGVDYQQKASANSAAFNASPLNANPSNPTSAMKLIGGKVSCSTCHGVHATDSSSSTFDSFSSIQDLKASDGSLLRTDRRAATADGMNICTNCHAGKVAHNDRGQNIQCTDCHGAHVDAGDGSVPNVWLVKRDMGAGRGVVSFTSMTNKNYMSPDGTGVCQSCHAVPTGSGYQFHLVQTNATCNGCHAHGNGKGSFSVDPSTACSACHGYPPAANSSGTGGYAAGYQSSSSFTDESLSGHASHAGSPYQKACLNCHNGNSHQTGTYQDLFIDPAGTVAATGGLVPVYDKSAQTCSNVYCHSNADPRGGAALAKTTPSWNGGKGKIIGTAGECGACHAAAGEPAPTWSTSHTKHVNGYGSNPNFTCNTCHSGTASGNSAVFGTMTARSRHTNGQKDVLFNSFASGGVWDRNSASCANVYCHSNVQGPAGVGAPTLYTSSLTWNGPSMTCGSCHPAMVKLGNISTATGSHTRHAQGYGFDCSTCHGSGYSAAGGAVAVATHVDGVITVALTGAAATNGAVPVYYQGNNPPGGGYSSCSNVYCHSNVQGSGGAGAPTLFAAPVWGAAPPACGSCHANMATSAAATGSHVKHVQAAGYGCPTCHNGAGKDPNPPFAATAQHANGTINIAFSGSAAGTAYSKGGAVVPGAGYGSCTNASCHADPYSTASLATPAWGAASGCAACHKGGGAFGAYSAPATGSHASHMALNGALCSQCHAGAAAGSSGGSAHIDGNIDVTNGYPANVAKHAAGTYTGTCSAAACHADPYSAAAVTSPVWGVSAGCAACHIGGGAFNGTGTAPATGSHNKHMAASATCGDCHAGASAGVSGGASHANGTIDVTNGYPAAVAKHAAGTYAGSCSTACHSTSTAAVATPVWGTASTCSTCHLSSPATGSHLLHLGISVNGSCSDCHAGAVADTSGGTSHFNGTIDVTNGYPANVAKHAAGSGYSSCSAASCHSNPYGTLPIATPVWGVENGNHCAACHNGSGAFDATLGSPPTGSHAAHMALAGALCSQCHDGAAKNTSGGTTHKNGTVDVTNGYPAAVARHAAGTYTGTCSTALCHGSSSPVWGVTTANDTCTKCHGTGTASVTPATRFVAAPNDPAAADTGKVSSNAKIGAHQTHLRYLNGFSNYSTVDYRCEACHGTLPSSGSHANGSSTPQGSFRNLATRWGAMSGQTFSGGTCSNTYCHNPAGTNGTLAAGNAGTSPAPSWSDATYIDDTGKNVANCSRCHLVPGSPGFTLQATHGAGMSTDAATNCAGCHGHDGDASGTPGRRHMDGIRYAGGGTSCDGCHDYDTTGSTTKTWGTVRNANYGSFNEGAGAHAKHIEYLKTRWGGLALDPSADYAVGYGLNNAAKICGTCHTNTLGNHMDSARQITFGDGSSVVGTSGQELLFNAAGTPLSSAYGGSSSTPSSVQAKTCSNISCHYFTSPNWSAY